MYKYGSNYDSDGIRQYLDSLSGLRFLTAEEEKKAFVELRLVESKLLDGSAIDEKENKKLSLRKKHLEKILFESCATFVVNISKSFLNRGLPLLDLIQEGNIGLLISIKKFDVSKGFRLTTYSGWWIRQSILRAIYDKGRTIRIPTHMQARVLKVEKHNKLLKNYLNREPSIEELSKFMNMKIEDVKYLLSISSDIVSLDINISEDSETNLIDAIADESCGIEESIIDEICSKEIDSIISKKVLDQKEYFVIQMRFGLTGFESHTLEETGKKMGITRERVRQIQEKTLRKLQCQKTLQSFRC